MNKENNQVNIVRFYETGDANVLHIESVPRRELKDHEVRITVSAIGLNRAELLFRQGKYYEKPIFPSNIGYEASGVVKELGAKVTMVKIGDRVSTMPAFSLVDYGVYGEETIVPETAVAAYPTNLTPQEGASIWTSYLTAYGGLIGTGAMKYGDTVLVTAATGSVGTAAIHIAKSEGNKVIATTRSQDKKKFLEEAGADHVILTESENQHQRISEITNGNGVNVVFDPIAGDFLAISGDLCAQGATIVEYGHLHHQKPVFPLLSALAKGLTVRGFTTNEIWPNKEYLNRSIQYIYDKLKEGEFKPIIDREFAFKDIVKAHRYMESNEQKGKIVINVN